MDNQPFKYVRDKFSSFGGAHNEGSVLKSWVGCGRGRAIHGMLTRTVGQRGGAQPMSVSRAPRGVLRPQCCPADLPRRPTGSWVRQLTCVLALAEEPV